MRASERAIMLYRYSFGRRGWLSAMMLMWYVNSGMLTYDEDEMPKIVPFDFITPNYLQNVVVCVVMVYILLLLLLLYGKNDQGLLYERICMDARVRLRVGVGGRTSICACVTVCARVWVCSTCILYRHILFFSFFSFLRVEYKPFTLNR